MTVFRFLLFLYIPLISLAVLPGTTGWVKDAIYPIRNCLTLALALGGGLALLALGSKGQSIATVIRQSLKRDTLWRSLSLFALAYCVWVLLSSAFSSMPGYSWLGHPSTQFGSLTLVACIIVLFLFASAAPITSIIRALTLTSLVMTLLALVEALGFRPLAGLIAQTTIAYPAATIGFRPHLGGWFAITALAPVFFYRHRPVDWWYWTWLISGLVGLGVCTTSAASLGTALAILLWLGGTVATRNGTGPRNWKQPLLVAALLGVSLSVLPPATKAISQMLGQTPPTLKDYRTTATLKTRSYLWKSAWNAALARPIFGWGDDTFGFHVFDYISKADAESLFRGELGLSNDYTVTHQGFTYIATKKGDSNPENAKTGSLLYIRPHNIIMDELYSHGFIGFFLFFIMNLFIIMNVMRFGKGNPLFFSVAFLPYAVYLLAWFYITSVTPLYFALIGCALYDLRKKEVDL